MAHYLTNQTISLSKNYGETEFNNASLIHVMSANNDVFPHWIDAPGEMQWKFLGCVWLIFLIGCYFRFILYEYMFQQYKLNAFKPINILTLLVAVLNHWDALLLVIYYTLMITNNDALENINGGHLFCVGLIYYMSFTTIFSFAGGLMMAIYRIILIKHPYMVQNRIKRRNLLLKVLFVGLSLSVLCVALDTLNEYQHLRNGRCVPSVAHMRSMARTLDEYEQSHGKPSIYAYWRSVRIGLTAVGFASIMAEIFIYVVFFHHMYMHDNSENIRRILHSDVIKKRNRTNAISFFTQFCSFLMELAWLMLFIITTIMGNKQNGLPFMQRLVRLLSFSLISMIEVLFSRVLRQRTFQLNIYDIIHGLN